MTMVFDTPEAINAVRAITLAHALEMYARHGMKASRLYTPRRMLDAASGITGKEYKLRRRGVYLDAAADIREMYS